MEKFEAGEPIHNINIQVQIRLPPVVPELNSLL